ncbi:hypothetical protein M9458_010886, partial [Cirrhinus mrigala]
RSERVWDSAHDTGTASQQTTSPTPSLPTWATGLALHSGHQVAAAQQEALLKVRRINEVTYQLELPANYRISPSFHVSLPKPVHPDADPGHEAPEPPPPLYIDGTPAYQVN